ncbi:cysteine synthase A [Algisphaera agarilytica]|uniref:cysteine synthase n=1 Tax=Algisphaera agarilytica TaxID=1385975 RepID=A0A7X0H6K4_9BACT|nr:cysteine synthase A [Algisphaera agarilytica]MBB6428755.1 cysteine synthase A [Algisphaera agarilytica]
MSTSAPTLLHGKTYGNVVDTVGNTPLIKLNRLAPDNGSSVYMKCEFFNPLASVKDRIGRAMIEAGEKAGNVNADTHIIEPTSGNTGIALAFVCAAKGYKLTLTMPESMSLERRALLKGLGANLVLTEAAKGMKGAIEKAAELVAATDNAWMPQQFENPANPEIHYRTTGPEIWADTQGKVDFLVAGVGTGGTVSGSGKFLKEQKPEVKAIAVEPVESPVISGGGPGPHKIQGIGAGFVPMNLDVPLLDGVEQVTSDDAFAWGKRLAKEEGILGGISSGANACAACRIAEANPSATIVTIGCSFGERYLSTPLFAD